MPKATINEAVTAVLKKVGHPLSIKAIYDKIIELDYYRFRAERPVGIVAIEIRRHCKGVEYSRTSSRKSYQLLNDGTYWLLDSPIPEKYKTTSSLQPKEEKKDSHNLYILELKERHVKYVEHFKQSLLKQLKEIDPKVFEIFSKKLLEAYGFIEMHVTAYTKDGGIDGYGKLKVGITHLSVAFQSKRWKNTTVSKKEIQSFRGDIQGKFEQGIYFTTSTYSGGAKTVSIQKGAVPIILIDGNTIIDIMIEKKLGIEFENLPIYINALDRALTEDI